MRRRRFLKRFDPGRAQGGGDVRGRTEQDVQRLPADITHLPNGLSCGSRRAGIDEDVRAAGRQAENLRIDGRIGDLVGRLGDDRRRSGLSETVPQAADAFSPSVVLLVENRDPWVAHRRQDVAGVEAAFCVVRRDEPDRPRRNS